MSLGLRAGPVLTSTFSRSVGRGIASSSASASASSRRRSGSRSSQSRKTWRRLERSGVLVNSCLEVDLERDVAHHRREQLAHARVVRVVDQVLLALGARDLVDAGEHAFEVAELLQQVRGGLVADAGDAGDVVGRVALEADEVRDQLGRDAVAVDHGLAVVDLRVRDAAGRGHDPHAVVDELVRVAVARHDHDGDAALLRLLGERGDHVVGLVALDRDVRVAEGLYERTEMRPLELQEVRPGAALRLVVGADLLAARTCPRPTRRRRAPGRSP